MVPSPARQSRRKDVPALAFGRACLAGRLPEIKKAADTKSTLRTILEQHGRSFGSTDSGRAWCIKALHPSDPAGEIDGVPDQSAKTVVMQSYTQVVDLAAPAGSVGTWEGEIYFKSDPASPVCYYTRDVGNAHIENDSVWNTALGSSVAIATTNMAASFESWRVTSAGLTVNLDATALTNQGNLVAAQTVVKPVMAFHPSAGTAARLCEYNVCFYQADDTTEYEQAAIMPNAYVGLAKEGCYMPLKLDSNHQRWHCPGDNLSLDGSLVTPALTGYNIPVADPAVEVSAGLYPGLAPVWWEAADGEWHGDVHAMPCTDNVGAICFKNLHLDAHLRLTFRIGVEATVQPGTALTPFQHQSAEYDPEAIFDYFYISRRMKDAYPAAYNDWGKLWDVIKGIAKGLGPFVKEIPLVGPAMYMAGSAIGKAIDARTKAAKAQKKQMNALAAALDVGRSVPWPSKAPPLPPKPTRAAPRPRLTVQRRR